MVLIWIVYLQVFFISFRRQRRPEILLTPWCRGRLKRAMLHHQPPAGASPPPGPVRRNRTGNDRFQARITDRTGLSEDELNNPSEATNQGPLRSGEVIDIGSF